MTRTLNAAVAVGFIGSVLIGLREAGHGATLVGDLLVLGASATAALYGVGSRRFGRDADTLPATSLQLVTAAVLAVPLVIGEAISGASHLGSADGVHIGAAVAVGLLGGVLPFLAFNASIRDMSLARASLHLNLIPVIAVALAVLLLNERLGWAEIVGGVLVIAAAAAAGRAGEAHSKTSSALAALR